MSAREALEKLCKWRSLLAGWHGGSGLVDAPGVKALRDEADHRLIVRVELNALLGLLIQKGVFTVEEFDRALEVEAKQYDKEMAVKFPGFRATAAGLEIFSMDLAQTTMKRLGFPE